MADYVEIGIMFIEFLRLIFLLALFSG